VIVTAAGQRLTRQQMIGILATNRLNTSHPLFQLTPPDWYHSSAPRCDAINEE
jgi:hypothetical protein